jgi:hypothetical protein
MIDTSASPRTRALRERGDEDEKHPHISYTIRSKIEREARVMHVCSSIGPAEGLPRLCAWSDPELEDRDKALRSRQMSARDRNIRLLASLSV